MRRFVALTLVLLMTLGLFACAKTPEQVLTAAVAKLAKQESMHYEMKMKMAMDMGIVSLNLSTAMSADLTMNPLAMAATTVMDMGVLGKMEMPMYVGMENGRIYSYVTADGSNWVKSEMDETAFRKDYNMAQTLEQYVKTAQSFTEMAVETVNGADAVRYDGLLSGDAIGALMTSTGISEQLASLGIDEAALTEAARGMENLTVSIWIDQRTGLPVKYYIDMTAMMKTIGNALTGLPALAGAALSFGSVTVEMTLSNFGGVEEIVIPEAALNAPLTVNADNAA